MGSKALDFQGKSLGNTCCAEEECYSQAGNAIPGSAGHQGAAAGGFPALTPCFPTAGIRTVVFQQGKPEPL